MMSKLFRDKVVIVTGASSGIGEAIAREFARNGSKVVLAARSEVNLAKITGEINVPDCEAVYVRPMSAAKMIAGILLRKRLRKFGTINILVNNAGISMRAGFTDVDLESASPPDGCKFLGNCLLHKICPALPCQK